MNRTVTLDLPAEVLDHANRVAEQSGRTLETLLAEWIARDVADAAVTAMFPMDREYYIYTPEAGDGASNVIYQALEDYRAQALLETLQAAKIAKGEETTP
ncbi:MAG: hypothetical protein M3Z04_16850 [Chloroflexota bacterium]|nr:hypothetical protein [Chloroflexota bacterium]